MDSDADVQVVTEGATKLTIGEGVIRLASLSAVVSTLLLAIPAAQADSDSGAARVHGTTHQSLPARLTRAAPERCRSVRRAVPYYRKQVWRWQDNRGAPRADFTPVARHRSCRWARYAVSVHRARARTARKAYLRWSYEWEWQRWLPDKWARIGACETGYGRRPGRWDWNSGTYQGAFGFYHGTWDQYKPAGAPSEAYLATPREQYQAALNVYAAHGYGAWGCGGA